MANKATNISKTDLKLVMDKIFHPKSIAVIGASSDDNKEKGGPLGRMMEFGYQGNIYPVNRSAETILGLKAYPSVLDIPGPVDFAIIVVPSKVVPAVARECVQKGVGVMNVVTAGFGETGKEAGRELQAELEAICSNSKTRLIGPNCLGVYSPGAGMTLDVRLSKEEGSIGFLSQSGVGARRLMNLACERGLRFSKAVSYGNAVDLNDSDFMEYFAADPKIKYVLTYVEGLKQGRRFFKAIRECAKVKPVIILKGGMSEGGAGAVASHTASLAGSRQTWQALFKQTGVIPVDSFEEAVEQMVAVVSTPIIRGRRVGLMGRGGGFGVIATDMCEAQGLFVPQFLPETREKLSEIAPAEAGSSVRNPVEIGLGRGGLSEYYIDGIKIVASDPQIDFIITFFNPEDYFHYGIGDDWVEDISMGLMEASKASSKPLIACFLTGRNIDIFKSTIQIQDKCQEKGIPCFSNLETAIKAISKLITYYEFKIGDIQE